MTCATRTPSSPPTQSLPRRLRTLAVGHTGNALVNIGFDCLLYATAIALLGPLTGGLLMTVASLVLDLLLLRFYDWSRTDWLGIEAIKSVRDTAATTRWQRMLQWLLQRGDGAALLVLSLSSSPLHVVLYLRRGAHRYDGMRTRDWMLFLTSTTIGNLYWILVLWGATSGAMKLWTNLLS